MHVRKATPSDTGLVHQILAEAGAALAAAGFHNWSPPRSMDDVARDIEEREVFIFSADSETIGTVSVGWIPTVPYDPDVTWGNAGTALYVNRLAVRPTYQGFGFGRRITAWVEDHARDAGADAVRLDALADNTHLLRFYTSAGYAVVGKREHSGWQFTVMQKMLVRDTADAGSPDGRTRLD